MVSNAGNIKATEAGFLLLANDRNQFIVQKATIVSMDLVSIFSAARLEGVEE